MPWGLAKLLILWLGFWVVLLGSAAWADTDTFDPAANPGYLPVGYGQQPAWILEKPQRVVPDPVMGFKNNPGQVIRSSERTANQIIWDKTYTIDENSLRVTPQSDVSTRTGSVSLWGDSFIFGIGLNDDETLAYFLSQRILGRRILNFGVGASATNMMLARLKEGDWVKLLGEGPATMLHIPLQADIGRINGFYTEIAWMGITPYFVVGPEGAVRAGTMNEYFSWRVRAYNLIRRYFPGFHGNWPLSYSATHLRYQCALIAASASEFKSRAPENSRFILVNHPLLPLPDEVNQCLTSLGVEVMIPKMQVRPDHRITFDQHPTRQFNLEFAEVLAQELLSH